LVGGVFFSSSKALLATCKKSSSATRIESPEYEVYGVAEVTLAKRVPQQRGLKGATQCTSRLILFFLQKEFLSNED